MLFGDCFPILSCDRNCLSLKHTIYRNLTQFFCTFKIHFLQQNFFLPSGQRRAAFSPGICPLVYDWQVPGFDGWPFPWISAELRQRVQIPALCGGPGTRQRDKHSEFWGALLLARSECSCGLWNCISSSWSPGGLAGQHCQGLFGWEPGPLDAGQDFPYEGDCWSWAMTLSEMGLLNTWYWLHLLKTVCGNYSLEIKWELGSVNTHILRQTLYVKLVCEAKELGLHPVVNGEPWRM